MANKIILVTGSSKGIGKKICEQLLENDNIVYGIARSEKEMKDMSIAYPNFVACIGDITDHNFILGVIKKIRKEHGKLDGLVNNAAIEVNEPIGMINLNMFEKILKVNVIALVDVLQLSARIMKKGGSIVNISSNVGLKGNPGQLSYSASKGAVNSITLTAAKELAEKKIRVNSVLPGLTNTEMIQETDEKFITERISHIKLGQIIEPEDVANMVSFLLSDKASMISGQIIAVDGLTIM
ncbi:SDR family NAD(P)-dependent oxidoreductase [Globicatella sulfidifaciens]